MRLGACLFLIGMPGVLQALADSIQIESSSFQIFPSQQGYPALSSSLPLRIYAAFRVIAVILIALAISIQTFGQEIPMR